jgi:protein arginine kinase activator
MWCEQCKKRQATVHVTKIINSHKTESHLCAVCAREGGIDPGTELGFLFEPNFSFHHLLTGLLENEYGIQNEKRSPDPETVEKCATCGLTFSDFRKTGLVGCANCYQIFADLLNPLLRRVHGNITHTGKVPKRTGGKVRIRKEIQDLRRMLQDAIRREAYEEAAKIRDEIKAKEGKLTE